MAPSGGARHTLASPSLLEPPSRRRQSDQPIKNPKGMDGSEWVLLPRSYSMGKQHKKSIGLIESIDIELKREGKLEVDFSDIKKETGETRGRLPRKSEKETACRAAIEEAECKAREHAEREASEEAQRRAKQEAERNAEEEFQRREKVGAEQQYKAERAKAGQRKMQHAKSLIVTNNKVKESAHTPSFRQRRADKAVSSGNLQRTQSRRGGLQHCAMAGGWYDAVARDWRKLATAPAALRNDSTVVLQASETSFGEALQYASPAIRGDAEVVMTAVKASMGRALLFASDTLRNSQEFVLEAMKRCATVLRYASKALRSDRSFMRDAVRRRAVSLCFTTPELRSDKLLVLEAVRCDGLALRYAAEELRSDRDFVVQATREAAASTETFAHTRSASAPVLIGRSTSMKKFAASGTFNELSVSY